MRLMAVPAVMSVALMLSMAGASSGATIYVDASLATGANNGSSWADAYRGAQGLTAAITASVSGDQIWVADGTYKPDASNRGVFFTLKSGVSIYGGFAGGEGSLSARNTQANIAVLSGDLAGNDGSGVYTDNSYHVVSGGTADSTASIDGFVIEGGNSNGSSANDTDRGGGVIFLNGASGRVRNCLIRNNRVIYGGGGIYVRSAAPAFEDCIIRDNLGANFGGGIDFYVPSSPARAVRFDRCSFINNQAARAGGVEIFGLATMTLSNCTFYNNLSSGSAGGGAVFVGSSGSGTLVNCTVVGNRSQVNAAAGVLNSGGTASVINSIVYFNTGPGGTQGLAQQINGGSANWSCVQAIGVGNNNTSADPGLTNAATGDLTLAAGSVCIDSGSNSLVGSPTPTLDVIRNPRFQDDPATTDTGVGTAPIVDKGAYEFVPVPPPSCPGDANGDQQVNVADLSVLLANFGGPASGPGSGDFNDDGQCNVADLSVLLANFGTGC